MSIPIAWAKWVLPKPTPPKINNGLNDVKELVLPSAPHANPDKFEIFQNYEVEVVHASERDGIRTHLKNQGIGTILQWGGKAVHEFEGLGFNCSLPFTEDLMRRCFLLPMNTSLSNDVVNYIIEAIRKYYNYGN